MVLTSKTGLLEGVRKPIRRQEQTNTVEFPNFSHPAPYTLRPFAGVCNPFPYGCSILCNHPADCEAKDVVKRAKNSWASEGKSLLLPEELATIRNSRHSFPYDDAEHSVPEELFRRYTDTDSRPLTPAPTLASVMTKGTVRRCVTPDPIPTHSLNPAQERTLLVLDLRRSHSQDILNWHGVSTSKADLLHLLTTSMSPSQTDQNLHTPQKKKVSMKKKAPAKAKTDVNQKLQQQVLQGVKTLTVPTDVDLITDTTGDSGDEEVLKRRGKQRRRRKKSGRDGSREPEKEFQGLPEPGETQVSAIGKDSQSTSTRPSLIFGSAPGELDVTSTQQLQDSSADGHKSSNVGDSFIDVAILKQLQRELTQEIIDSEFDQKRHKALKEALNIFPKRKTSVCEELKKLKQELRILPDSTEHLLTLPRNFTRRSSRFELPLDSRLLNTLTPMEYMKSYISISSARLQLYNIVFNRHREELDEDETKRLILGKHAMVALGEVMGCPLTTEQFKYIQDLIGWKDSDQLDFRTWGGLCALCERILAPQLISSLPSRQEDPCHEVEHADFETLPRKLHGLEPDPRLATILHAIRDL